MANLNFSFTFKGGKFCLCCTVKGTTIRHYKEVSGSYKLSNPDFERWNRKEQKFLDPTPEAIANNGKLNAMMAHYVNLYQMLSETMEILDGKTLFAHEEVASKVVAEKKMTFGDFICQIIRKGKTESNKRPSKNYQKYITLLHKLEREGAIINKPLKNVCNKDFIDFGNFILEKLTAKDGKTNYANLMKLFKAVHTKAYNSELNDHTLRYQYMKDAPTINSNERVALTKEQYLKFCTMDLARIPQSGVNGMFYKELYRRLLHFFV